MVEHKNGRFQKKKNPYLDRRESKSKLMSCFAVLGMTS